MLKTPSTDPTLSLAEGRDFSNKKYGERKSKYIAARQRAGYVPPEDRYEWVVRQLIAPDTNWLDVGCGKSPFPNNSALSGELSATCRRFVGIDPDPAVGENKFVHDGYQSFLDDFHSDESFDVVTARMVVEHVSRPEAFVAGLKRVTQPGSRFVVFTVNWPSPTALAAHVTPLSVHCWVKRYLWGTKPEDTFPTEYRMNRRTALRLALESEGFQELVFTTPADASLFWRIPLLRQMELQFWRCINWLGLPYPESCILAVYQRTS